MDNLEPITRNEMFLNGDDLEPITREEMILAGADLEPITRHEWFLKRYRGGGGGGGYDLVNIPDLPADIASFNDGTDLPMASLKVAVTPYQDLSHGDPSPENICPIIGWDEAVVTRCGKNIASVNSATAGSGNVNIYNGVGIQSNITIAFKCNNFSFTNAGASLVVIIDSDNQAHPITPSGFGLSANTVYNNRVSGSFTINYKFKRIYIPTTGYTNISGSLDDIQIELGTTATTYSPYNGATYTIDLDGTRYGGVVDATNGTMTITNVLKTFSSGISKHATIDNAFIINNAFSDAKAGQCKCNMFKYNSAVLSGLNLGEFSIDTSYTRLAIKTDVYATAEEFNNAISNNPITVWYPIATPITVQLAPTPVKSLEGVNKIFANCGQITEVKYFKKA